MLQYKEKAIEDLKRWIWKHCPFCDSTENPTTPSGGGGGYQEHITLKCSNCGNQIKFVTDWSPKIDLQIVNEIPEMIQDDVCPYLSIQKKVEHILLQCCSCTPRDCFGRSPENCYSYHKTKLKELIQTEEYTKAVLEAEATMRLWKEENPEFVPPLGMHELVEIKRRILNKNDWISWVKNTIDKLEFAEDYGSAASIAFVMAEKFEETEFWKQSSRLYDKYIEKLKIDLDAEGGFIRKKRNRKIVRAEIMSLEARSEIEKEQRVNLLKMAGNKWLELYEISADPFSTPNFLCYALHLRNKALAEPTEAAEWYMKAYEFLADQLDRLEYPRERMYYEGHSKYFLSLHYLSKANYTDDENKKVDFLEKSVKTLDEAIALHKTIGMNASQVSVMLNCIKSIICVEKFMKTERFELISDAAEHLESAKTYCLPRNIVKTIDALIGSYKKALSAVENPRRALLLMARARGKLEEFVELLTSLSLRDIPILKMLEFHKNYLSSYLNIIDKRVTSFAGRKLSFNNIITALDEFKEITERQLYPAFKIKERAQEETGRTLVQAYLAGSFPQRKIQFREVQVAKGRSDNMLIVDNERYPFEVKIWKGQAYYQKGLRQIKYYLNHENVPYGFYIIFDPRTRDFKSCSEVLNYDSKRIYQVYIHINPKKP